MTSMRQLEYFFKMNQHSTTMKIINLNQRRIIRVNQLRKLTACINMEIDKHASTRTHQSEKHLLPGKQSASINQILPKGL